MLSVITGANRGIGFQLCRLLKERGDDVVGVCRRTSPELDGLGVTVASGTDVTQDASVNHLAETLAGESIDLLINNAGILRSETLENFNFDTMRKQFEVNSLGPLRVTYTLLPCLSRGSRIGIVTSRMGSIADNTSGGRYGYRMSKAAVNMAAVSLAHDLKPRGISLAILHPGFVRTDMTGNTGNVPPGEAAADLIARLDALTLETSGTFWHAKGEVLPW